MPSLSFLQYANEHQTLASSWKGVSAHCCSWDEDECCFLSWYTVWWIWVGAILLIVVAFSVLICCFRNRRPAHHSARHMIVVHSPPPRYVYGSIGADLDQHGLTSHHAHHGHHYVPVPNVSYKVAPSSSSPPPYIDMPQYKV